MLQLQDAFYGNPNFGLVSITIDPEHDTALVLKEHAALLGVKHYNWHFLTGDKKYIYNLANKGFNLYAGENNKAAGGFEHSGLFALVDKEGNIHTSIGKASFAPEKLAENAVELIQTIAKLKPSAAKGTYFRGISISSTMSPGLHVDTKSIPGI